MGVWEAFWLGVVFGPIIWAAGMLVWKLLEDLVGYLERKWNRRTWDKDQKRKHKLERELEKLNERQKG